MNTDHLAKHYSSLTPTERLRLLMAASARGDEQECDRLATSAPCMGYRLPHHFALDMAFRDLCALQRMHLLSLAALYFQNYGMGLAVKGKEGKQLFDRALYFGYLLNVNFAGWRKVRAELNLDPDLCMTCLPGQLVLDMAAVVAPQVAFTAKKTLAYIRREDKTAAAALTAEEVAAGLKKSFDVRADWWGA